MVVPVMPKGKGKHGSKDKHHKESRGKKKREQQYRYTKLDPEYQSLSRQLFIQGMKLKDVLGDGNCLFRALVDQLNDSRVTHRSLRTDIVEFMRTNAQDFEPFMEEEGVSYDEYIRDLMSDGVYGGNDAIVAFARYYNCTVVIHQPNSPKWEVHGCIDSTQAMQQRCFHIAYLNGEHYCSVVPVDSSTENDPCSSRPHKSSHEVFRKAKQTTPHYIHSGTDDMFGMCEETNVVETLVESTGCKDKELAQSVLRENSYDLDMAIIELLQIMDITGRGSLSPTVSEPLSSIQTESHKHHCPKEDVVAKETIKIEKQSHVSNRKRKENAKKERKERRAKQKQTDKIADIELPPADPIGSLSI